MTKEFYSTNECAEILKVSRITVFNRIKKGEIKARQVGGSYLIAASELERFETSRGLRESDKKNLRTFINKLINDYGDFLQTIE